MKVEILREFGVDTNAPSYVPVGELLRGRDGAMYGYTREDGTNTFGTVFRFDPVTKDYRVLKTLSPSDTGEFFGTGQLRLGSLKQGADGFLYGVTRAVDNSSGMNFSGSSMFFRLKPDGSEFSILKQISKDDGVAVADGVLLASDGKLYGAIMSVGGIFRMNMDGSGYEDLSALSSLRPSNHRLVEGSDGKLYGTMEQGLDLFRANKDGTEYQTIAMPRGVNNEGVVVRFFEGADGKLYVLQRGAWNAEPALLARGDTMDALLQGSRVYRMDKDGSNREMIFQFSSQASLPTIARGMTLGSDSKLYITCESTDLPNARGAVFRINLDGAGFELLHLFKAETGDGRDVSGGVTEGADGRLYGLTEAGMGAGAGGIYGLDKDGSDYGVEHQCVAMIRQTWANGLTHTGDAAYPAGGLVDGGDGYLYGTSMYGGVHRRIGSVGTQSTAGAVFKLKKDGTGYQILYSNAAGSLSAPLALGSDGYFYGIGFGEEASNMYGFVFRIGKTIGTFQTVRNFNGSSEGKYPGGQLVEGSDGWLYGLTSAGGLHDRGVAYRVSKDGQSYEVIHDFQTSEGTSFQHGLRFLADGKLYGAKYQGGTGDLGTVFRMNSDGSNFEVILEPGLLGSNAIHYQYPASPPVLMPDGKLYGLSMSTFYWMNADGSGLETLGALGQNYAESHLHIGPDGHFYFLSESGLFRFDRFNRAIELLASLSWSPINGNISGNVVFSSADEIYIIQTQGPMFNPLGNGSLAGIPGLEAFFMQGGVLKLTPGTDYGDAPSAAQSGFAQSYPVTMAENGARHIARGPLMGSRRDAEKDGAHSNAATGDDPTDEIGANYLLGKREGVILGTLRQGEEKVISVLVAGANGKLDTWIDFNRDGDWDDAGERVYNSFPVIEGENWLVLPVPVTSSTGKTYARFRLSTEGNLTPYGLAQDGEVEDYEVTIEGASVAGSNNNFADAQTLKGALASAHGSTKSAGLETSEPLPIGFSSAVRSIWYRWVARGSGGFVVKVSSPDAVIGIWRGQALNALTQIAGGRSSVMVNEAVAGGEYWIQVTDTAAAGVDFVLRVEGSPAANEAYFKSVSNVTPGKLGFELRGGGDVPYSLEYTEDWLTWKVLETGTLTDGILEVEDAETGEGMRFYRLRLLPHEE